ncbi:MAG: tetratricopeptide repeat protein [Anaerolineae bacterium]
MRTLEQLWRVIASRFHFFIGISYQYFGNAHSLRSEYEKAISAFSRAITADPAYARAYLNRGILYWREMDHPRRAILDLTTAHDLDPSLTEAQFNRGIAHQQLREYQEAIRDFEAYLDEGDHPYWREYAESMIRELREWVPADGSTA